MSGSSVLMDHFTSPRNRGRMDFPTATGMAGGRGLPRIIIYLRVCDEVVVDTRFLAVGCGYCIAAALMLTELVVGKPIAGWQQISAAEISTRLGGFPPQKAHCPDIAIKALRVALSQSRG